MNSNYIKVMLTVITVCLVLIVIELASLVPVNAQQDVVDVNIQAINGNSIQRVYDGWTRDDVPLPVTIIQNRDK